MINIGRLNTQYSGKEVKDRSTFWQIITCGRKVEFQLNHKDAAVLMNKKFTEKIHP